MDSASETVLILQVRYGKTLIISNRRKDIGVGSLWYKESGGTSAEYSGNDVSPLVAPGRTDESATDIVYRRRNRYDVAVDVESAVSLRFPYCDATFLAMLTRLQPDVLLFTCQSYRGGESAVAQW